jgi:hypothetical protein
MPFAFIPDLVEINAVVWKCIKNKQTNRETNKQIDKQTQVVFTYTEKRHKLLCFEK